MSLLPVGGCEDEAPEATPGPPVGTSPAVSSPVPPSNPAATAVQEALAAYRGMWQAFVAASDAGAANAPELAKFATGRALQTLRGGLTDNAAKGLHSQGSPVIEQPLVTAVSPVDAPTSVSVRGCVDTTNWLLYRSDGKPANANPGGRRRVDAEIRLTGGAWKVTQVAVQGVNTCG